jgi:hypothetical protein
MAAQSPLHCGDGQNPAYRPSGVFMIRLLAKAAAAFYIDGIYGSAKEVG